MSVGHDLILAIDHWIVPGTATLHWLHCAMTVGGGRADVRAGARRLLCDEGAGLRGAEAPLSPGSLSLLRGAACRQRAEEVHGCGGLVADAPQLNGRPGEKVLLPEWVMRWSVSAVTFSKTVRARRSL